MANGLYRKAAQDVLEGKVNLLTDTVKVQLIGWGYPVDFEQHQWLADIAAEFRQVPAVTLTGKSCTHGIFDADDVLFAGVHDTQLPLSAAACVVLYLDNGTNDPASTPLLAYLDTLDGAWPAVIVGTRDISVGWANSLNRIFRI